MKPIKGLSSTALVSLGLLYLIWGSTFLSVRILVEYLPPLSITYGRNFVAGGLLLLWSKWAGHWKAMPWAHWRMHLMAGVLLIGLGNSFMSMASRILPSGFNSVFMALGPLLLIVFFWFQGQKPSWKMGLGAALGLIGIALLSSSKSMAIPGKEADFFKGIGYLSIAVLAWNFGVFRLQTTGANAYHFSQSSAIQMLTGSILVFLISTGMGDLARIHLVQMPTTYVWVFLYLALIGSMLGFSLFAYLSKECDATIVATYTYVNPVVALFLGHLVLDEVLHPNLIIASIFILSALILISLQSKSNQK